MGTCLVTLAVALTFSSAGQASTSIKSEEKDYLDENFQRWWETEFVWAFDDLPTKGSVPKHRVPYSGHDYPDSAGGTIEVLRKYDRAFHDGRLLATAYEHTDTTSQKERTVVRGRIFGILRIPTERTPGWHGHCNGWAAAAIRHAEPRNRVTRNGVTFTPADIKGLLAEIYMYNHSEFLGGVDAAINPGTFHAVITNWIGRGSHPVAMDTALDREVFNYPIHAYAASSAKRPGNAVEVKMNIAYTLSTKREFDQSQHLHRVKYFHYMLQLDDQGRITGGSYFPDSDRIDMLWVPLHAVASGQEGNEKGNPHVDVAEVLSIWRESVPEEVRNQWLNIDPLPEDAVPDAEDGNAEEDTPGTPTEAMDNSGNGETEEAVDS
jgi:hypothetical protein